MRFVNPVNPLHAHRLLAGLPLYHLGGHDDILRHNLRRRTRLEYLHRIDDLWLRKTVYHVARCFAQLILSF